MKLKAEDEAAAFRHYNYLELKFWDFPQVLILGREEKMLNPHEHRDDHKEVYPNIPSNILKLSSVKSGEGRFGHVYRGRHPNGVSYAGRWLLLSSWIETDFRARPLFNDRKKFSKLADPRLQGKFPVCWLFQALAVASMLIQERSPGRPLIGDVVTALSYLANQTYDSSIAVGSDNRIALEKDDNRSKDERGGRTSSTEEGEGSEQKWNLDGFKRDNSPRENARNLNRDLDWERAVAEAKMWGENLRKNNVQRNFNGNNGQ